MLYYVLYNDDFMGNEQIGAWEAILNSRDFAVTEGRIFLSGGLGLVSARTNILDGFFSCFHAILVAGR